MPIPTNVKEVKRVLGKAGFYRRHIANFAMVVEPLLCLTRQGIKFEWLYCIHLDSLSSLECFYSGIDALELPSLSQVDVRQCPKMQVFSRGEINVKSFKGIQASYDSNDELVFDNDLNSSVKRVFLLQVSISSKSIG
jgi:hypothetical protein